jgi:hypothetical protein
MTTAVQKILAEVKALSPAERQEIEAALREPGALRKPATDEDLAALLEREGVIAKRDRPLSPLPAFEPISVKGKPLSETIIEERR